MRLDKSHIDYALVMELSSQIIELRLVIEGYFERKVAIRRDDKSSIGECSRTSYYCKEG